MFFFKKLSNLNLSFDIHDLFGYFVCKLPSDTSYFYIYVKNIKLNIIFKWKKSQIQKKVENCE